LKIVVFGDHVWVTVNAARRILTLQMDETTCRYEEELQMYLIRSPGSQQVVVLYLGTICFKALLIVKYSDRLLLFPRQLLLIPNRVNKLMDHIAKSFYPLP
jgi:hypothetical protein